MATNSDGSIKDDGTLSGYYESRREEQRKNQAERAKAETKKEGK